MATEFDEGLLTGILIGEGHFGGDGRQAHVTLRMHERHETLFRWIERTFPGGRLYGPYDHGGRRYYQWMARGHFLREVLVPILRRRIGPELDQYADERFRSMLDRYARQLSRAPGASAPDPPGAFPVDSPGASDTARGFARPNPVHTRASSPAAGDESDVAGRIFSRLRGTAQESATTRPPPDGDN